jgi:hypothetical protein
MEQTHYSLLEVAENATDEEIQAAFKGKAREVHPDKVAPGNPYLRKIAAEAFKDLSEAKTILLDHAERRKYDAELAYLRGSRVRNTLASSPPSSNRPPAPTPVPQRTQKYAFWKPTNTTFGVVALIVLGIGCLLLPGGIAGSLATTFLGLALVLLSLALLCWRHGMRPSTDAKVLGGSVFLFIFAATSLAAWVRLPSVDPKIAEAPVGQLKPLPQLVAISRPTRTWTDPDAIATLQTKPKANSKTKPVIPSPGAQNQPLSSRSSANDRTMQDLVLERNPSVTATHAPMSQPTPSDLNTGDLHGSYFTLGSTKDQVLAVQGTPTRVSGSEWAYGLSKVKFRNDRVISWRISDVNPLRAKMLPAPAISNPLDYFTVGSTKDEVLAVQGTPTRVSDSEWAYGLSKVKFRNDRVISWRISEFNPLKARKLE